MGMNSAGKKAYAIIRESSTNIPNVTNILDDITIARNRETDNTALRAVFKQFIDLGLTMNRNMKHETYSFKQVIQCCQYLH